MDNDVLLRAIFEPLSILTLTEPLPENLPKEPGSLALMFLGEVLENNAVPLDVARCRYSEITDKSLEPWLVPSHDGTMRHVIRPLKEAKQ